jgi:hypothetical protein
MLNSVELETKYPCKYYFEIEQMANNYYELSFAIHNEDFEKEVSGLVQVEEAEELISILQQFVITLNKLNLKK